MTLYTRRKKKSRKTKIKVAGLYWEWSEILGSEQMEEESRRQIRMGYHSEGDTG
jgi:hypothetical protein